jgi:hypothetical protein
VELDRDSYVNSGGVANLLAVRANAVSAKAELKAALAEELMSCCGQCQRSTELFEKLLWIGFDATKGKLEGLNRQRRLVNGVTEARSRRRGAGSRFRLW